MYTTTTPAVLPLAERLLDALFALGWSEGAPRHVRPETLAIDRRTAALIRCQACGRKGGRFVPLCRGSRYRALSRCEHCPAYTEV
jgi:hypothetical protein